MRNCAFPTGELKRNKVAFLFSTANLKGSPYLPVPQHWGESSLLEVDMETKEVQTPGPFLVHKSSYECKQFSSYTGAFSEQGMLSLPLLMLIYNLREPNSFCPTVECQWCVINTQLYTSRALHHESALLINRFMQSCGVDVIFIS